MHPTAAATSMNGLIGTELIRPCADVSSFVWIRLQDVFNENIKIDFSIALDFFFRSFVAFLVVCFCFIGCTANIVVLHNSALVAVSAITRLRAT
jgi:hypothetical protein